MTDPIIRDIDIVTSLGQDNPQAALNPKTGELLGPVIYVDFAGAGVDVGTLSNPTYMENGVEMAGNDGVVVALANTGPIDICDVFCGEGTSHEWESATGSLQDSARG